MCPILAEVEASPCRNTRAPEEAFEFKARQVEKWRSGEGGGGIKWQCVGCVGLKERIVDTLSAVQKAKVVQPSVASVEPKGRRRDVCGKTWELSASQKTRLFNGALYTKDLREVGFFNACLLYNAFSKI